jgi:hypothetical protein
VALVARIDALLNREGYTIKGVQKLLSERGGAKDKEPAPAPAVSGSIINELRAIRNSLSAALEADLAA